MEICHKIVAGTLLINLCLFVSLIGIYVLLFGAQIDYIIDLM